MIWFFDTGVGVLYFFEGGRKAAFPVSKISGWNVSAHSLALLPRAPKEWRPRL